MAKQIWRPGTMVYPVPAVLVSCGDPAGRTNVLTVAWTGTVSSDPVMAYVSVRPERWSYGIIRESGEFVINLTTKELARATDLCGVKSGRDLDKWEAAGLTREKAEKLRFAPLVKESPVNIECRVKDVHEYGAHHMFVGEVLCVHADEEYLDENGRFDLGRAGLMAYSHGEYRELGKVLGTFGWSVKKRPAGKKR